MCPLLLLLLLLLLFCLFVVTVFVYVAVSLTRSRDKCKTVKKIIGIKGFRLLVSSALNARPDISMHCFTPS